MPDYKDRISWNKAVVRSVGTLFGVFAINGCAHLPAANVSIDTSNADAAYIVFNKILKNKSDAQKQSHIERYFGSPLQLPSEQVLRVGGDYYVVPVCQGSTKWSAAKVQRIPKDAKITVRC